MCYSVITTHFSWSRILHLTAKKFTSVFLYSRSVLFLSAFLFGSLVGTFYNYWVLTRRKLDDWRTEEQPTAIQPATQPDIQALWITFYSSQSVKLDIWLTTDDWLKRSSINLWLTDWKLSGNRSTFKLKLKLKFDQLTLNILAIGEKWCPC